MGWKVSAFPPNTLVSVSRFAGQKAGRVWELFFFSTSRTSSAGRPGRGQECQCFVAGTHTHLPHPVCTLKGEIKTLLIPCCRGDLGVEQTREQGGRMIPPSENRTGEGKLTYGKGH